jgi:hypothetical protein
MAIPSVYMQADRSIIGPPRLRKINARQLKSGLIFFIRLAARRREFL